MSGSSDPTQSRKPAPDDTPATATAPRGRESSSPGPTQSRSPGFSLKSVQGFLGRKFPGTVRASRQAGTPSAAGPATSASGQPPPGLPPALARAASGPTSISSSTPRTPDTPSKGLDPRMRTRSLSEELDGATISAVAGSQDPSDAVQSIPRTSSGTFSPDGMSDSRRDKFTRVLGAERVDVDQLRELAWSGVPAELRPACWRLLTGYAPAVRERVEEVLRRKREEYSGFVESYYAVGCDAESAEEAALRSEEEMAIIRQIRVDCPRTAPQVPFFHTPQLQRSLERILFVRAVRNPASGYVQGFNDLATPFLAVFLAEVLPGDMDSWDVTALAPDVLTQVEADSYWCLCKLLDSIQDHYTFAQRGIQLKVFKLSELVRRIDEGMHAHMEEEGIQFLQFAFRWFNCLLLREIPFALVPRLWDTYIAEGDTFADFLVYAAAAFFETWAEDLKGLEFQEMIIFLQKLPTDEWGSQQVEMVLSKAFMYRAMFERAQSHLTT